MAYALSFGIQTILSTGNTISVGYQFINQGSVELDKAGIQNTIESLKSKNLGSHLLSLTLTL